MTAAAEAAAAVIGSRAALLSGARPLLKASADGWRGRLGEGFTPADAGTLVGCLLDRLGSRAPRRILITHDSRSGGVEAARHAAAAVRRRLPEAGIDYRPLLPTPVASGRLTAGEADLAVLITASHNPAGWNGVKIKIPPGNPLAGEDEAAVDSAYRAARVAGVEPEPPDEAALPAPGDTDSAVAGHVAMLSARIGEPGGPPLRVVVDGLNGVAGRPARLLLDRLGWETLSLGEEPRADFGGLVPDPTLAASRARCAARMTAHRADLGLVLDGDGDRMIVLDAGGTMIQSQELAAALIRFAPERILAAAHGPIVATTTCGQMIRRLAAAQSRELIEVPVGFKYVVRHLRARPGSVGVGAVGDIGFEPFATDRDPMAVMLLLNAVLRSAGRPIGSLIRAMRRDLALEGMSWFDLHRAGGAADGGASAIAGRAARLLGWEEARPEETVDGTRVSRPGGEWILVRGSTTEGGWRLCGELAGDDAERLAAEWAGPAPETGASA